MQISIKDLDFSDLLLSESGLNILNPISTYGNLNAELLFNFENKSGSLIISDVSALLQVSFSYKEVFFDDQEIPPSISLYIDFYKFIYCLKQYQYNSSNLEIQLTKTDNLTFTIIFDKDQITLPCYESDVSKISDKLFPLYEEWDNEMILSNDNKNKLIELYSQIDNSLAFLSKDEIKNNACALYANKFIVNDPRHVLILNNKYPLNINNFISLHKRNMRLYNRFYDSEKEFHLEINEDRSKLRIKKNNVLLLMSNNMSNINPPTEEDLLEIKPLTKIAEVSSLVLFNAVKFFTGFYTSSSEFRTLSLSLEKDSDELKLFLKDTGISGFGSCLIEKSIKNNIINPETYSITIIYDSLKDYLAIMDDSTNIEIYYDEDKPSLYLKGTSEVYLAKL